MCGAFGYVGTQNIAAKVVLEGLQRLEYRGYDSWGVAEVTRDAAANSIVVKKETGKIGGATVDELPDSSLAIGHTRWATHGGVTVANAHPHLDCSADIAVIHNGIVENNEALRTELEAAGHVFVSETDTEVIAHLLEDALKKMTWKEAFCSVFQKLDGLNAVVAIATSQGSILAARNGSPLVVGFGANENFLASDPTALLPYTKEVYFLEDFECVEIFGTGVEYNGPNNLDSETVKNKVPKEPCENNIVRRSKQKWFERS